MAFVTVYDLDGQPHERESIDAHECVRDCGWSMTAPAEEEPEPQREEMKAFLVSKGVAFPANIKAAALADLYNSEKAKG